MRLLVVGHSYVTAFAQDKYIAMKQLDSNLQIRLVTPREVDHVFMRYRQEIAIGMNQEEVVPIKEMFGKSNMTYILNPFRLIFLLKKFNPDLIHIEEDPHSLIGLETVFLTKLISRKSKISFFVWDNLARKRWFPLNCLKWAFTKYTLFRSSLVVCGNREAQKLLKNPKGYKGKSLVLPQVGLNQDDYVNIVPKELNEQFSRKHDVPLIGFMGRLVPEKGVILLLEALSRLQHLPWKLLIVGSGPLKEEIQIHWKSCFGNRLILLGAVPHNEVPGYLKSLDIFVLPSFSTARWKEQFGLTLAQAMLAGVACVGSSSGAIPEVLGPGGFVFKERNVDSLVDILETLIRSKKIRNEFGETAKKFALQRYTNSVVAEAYLTVFRDLCNN